MEIFFKDIEIFYKKSGDKKETIFFLHGWGGSTNSFNYFSEELKNKYTCISLDFPPFGNSEMPYEPWTLNDYCEIIRLIQKKENIQKFHIIAHSFGGRVAILFASRYNESVDKILLTGSAGLKSKFSAKRQLKILEFKLLKKLGFKNLEGYGSSDYRTLPNVMKKTFVNIINQQLEKECAGITQQTLLVFGENDSETPIYMAKKFKRLIKNSEIIIFKNCAHFAYLENPQLFLKIAKSFLKG